MKKISTTTVIVPIIGFLLFLLTSCKHKDFTYPNGSGALTVTFDWTKAPAAQPEGMLLSVFSGKSQPVTFHIPDHEGGHVALPIGAYQLIAHNDNAESVHAAGTTWTDYHLYALPTDISSFARMFAASRRVPRAPGTDGQKVVFEPDEMWASALPTFQTEFTHNVTMAMEPVTEEYIFTIENVENLANVVEMAATISGMAGVYYPATRQMETYHCIIPFAIDQLSGSSMRGAVRTFGNRQSPTYHEGDNVEHKLVVYMMLNDGNKYYSSFDVTDAITEARQNVTSDTQEITLEIVIDEFVIPEPLNNGSGMHAEVDEWQEIAIDIRM